MYVVHTDDRYLYCGITKDVNRRIREHNKGRGAKFLRGKRLPAALLAAWHFEGEDAHSVALKAEAWFKKQSRRQKCRLVFWEDQVPREKFPWTFGTQSAYCERNQAYIRGAAGGAPQALGRQARLPHHQEAHEEEMKKYRVILPAYTRVEEIHNVEAGNEEAAKALVLDSGREADETIEDGDYYEIAKSDMRVEDNDENAYENPPPPRQQAFMKIGIVPASLIAEEGRLDAEHYLLPTAAKEKELARKKKALVSTQTAIENLETEITSRKAALAKKGVTVIADTEGSSNG